MMCPENKLLQEAISLFCAERPEDSHKGDYGRVLVVAGSEGMTGAAYLCAKAALHMGAGLVYIAAPRGLLSIYETLLPEAVKCPVGENDDVWFKETHFSQLCKLSCGKDAIIVGPGMGRHPETGRLVRGLLSSEAFGEDARGIILDADGLRAWGKYLPELSLVASRRLILTPHEGEFSHLTGFAISYIHQNRRMLAMQLSQKLSGATVLLKGCDTVCTDGQDSYINTTGNAGMATGGSGDVLAGMIGGLVATDGQTQSNILLAAYGAALHGFCGDRVSARFGQRFVTAARLIEEMGALCNDAG